MADLQPPPQKIFLHKIESTTNASHLLWDWPTVKDRYSLPSIVFIVQNRQYSDAGRGKACLILWREHGVQKIHQPLLVWKRILTTYSKLLELK